jgi:hypothetical protein
MRFRPTGRTAALVLVTAAVIVPLGVFGAPALARSASSADQYGHSSSSQYQYKVAICHHTHSKKHPFHVIVVSNKAVAKHMLRHGDTLAPCPPAPTAPTTQHGHGNGNGNSGNNGSNTNGPGNSNGHGKGHNK